MKRSVRATHLLLSVLLTLGLMAVLTTAWLISGRHA